MLHKLIKSVLFPLSIMPLIGSCSIFEPKTKVIEYDEEVKLSDGSMIWVHIKRHYERSSGREISNWFQGYEKGWGAKEVEISWDTGFPNVGRKTFVSNSSDGSQIFTLDKINERWYIIASVGINQPIYSSGVNIGNIPTNKLFIINKLGGFEKPLMKDMPNLYRNIFYYNVSGNANISSLSWDTKLNDVENKSLLGKQLY